MAHAAPSRGMIAAGQEPELQGAKFGRLFPNLPAASYGANAEQSLQALAEAMVSPFDAPLDGPDDEESGIPALYTYLGQFVDHDLTFSPESSFAQVKDPKAQFDFRTPAFDLDNIYGRGPGDQPYLYEKDGKSLKLGVVLPTGSPGTRDLQRNSDGVALIGDPRNDENAIISQLQGLMIRFHNALVQDSPSKSFTEIQADVRHHYQYVVANDFLSRIVNAKVLNELKTKDAWDQSKIKFFCHFPPPLEIPYMPLEFAVAAYRIGHSMIRPAYRLNDGVILPIFPVPPEVLDEDVKKEHPEGFPEGLTGFRELNPNWGIDWGRFIDIDTRSYGFKEPDAPSKLNDNQIATNRKRLQLAYRIDTALTKPLGTLPLSVASNPPASLALRNLKRGLSFGMPSGQQVAKAMGVPCLPDSKILIGQGVDNPDPGSQQTIDKVANKAFAGNCPLWTYCLAEAMQNHANPDPKAPVAENKTVSTPQLGPVGGRIVAEVFLGLLFADPGSFLNVTPKWTPPGKPDYKLKDLVAKALSSPAPQLRAQH